MRRVFLESPYQGGTEENLVYLDRCIADCLKRGEAPYASHKLYPGALDDSIPVQRELGMAAGEVYRACTEASIFYLDRGLSPGMKTGLERAVASQHPIECRYLDKAADGHTYIDITGLGETAIESLDRALEVRRVGRK